MIIGLADEVVQLQPYTRAWVWLFRIEKLRLWLALGRRVVDIQHVGSTAIPGMAAKPILDIHVGVTNFETAFQCVGPLERLGYEYKGENGDLRHYYLVKGHPTSHHLYLLETRSQTWQNALCFRDYLIQNPDMARTYAELKQELARRYPTNRAAYQEGKKVFRNRCSFYVR